MGDETVGEIPWSLWAIGGLARLWNLMGVGSYLGQMSPEGVAALPETHRAIIEGRPAWATGGFAISVFAGALGGLLLLLGRWAAYPVFIASLLGTVVTMIHTVEVARAATGFGPFEISMLIAMLLGVAAFFVGYSKRVAGRGWIRR